MAVRILTEIGVLSERMGVLDLLLVDLDGILFGIHFHFRFGFILRELSESPEYWSESISPPIATLVLGYNPNLFQQDQ